MSKATGKRSRTLAALQDHNTASEKLNDLDSILYGDKDNIPKLRKLLKEAGEEKWEKLTKTQVNRTIERYLKQGIINLNAIRRAVGEKEKKEEAADTTSNGTSGSNKKAKTKAKEEEAPRRSSGVFGLLTSFFSPRK